MVGATVYTQVLWFVFEALLPPKSPKLGDFEIPVPPRIEGLGGLNAAF